MSTELDCRDGANMVIEDTDGNEIMRYVVEITYDDDASINDYDSDGSYEWIDPRWGRSSDRPAHMNGSAMKLDVMNGQVWWQPMDGYWHNLNPDEQRAERSRIADLISFGFVVVTVERQERCSMGHWHEMDSASLGGLEWNVSDSDYGQEVVNELLAELAPVSAS